jgi:chromate transporter
LSLEVFRVFLMLGLTSFGGPVAHLGYFRREFVERRQWLSEPEYAAILGLCQFLPGPASSQTGFCIGLMRARWQGGLAAWVGFTLPSAVLMFLFAQEAAWFKVSRFGIGLLHGLQLAAIAVVAQAVWTMARNLCPDTPRRALAVAGLLVVALVPGSIGQLAVLAVGASAGLLFLKAPAAGLEVTDISLSSRAGLFCLAAFLFLLVFSIIVRGSGNLGLFNAFYRTGALVFGGGHVVLPLLHDAVVSPGWVPAGAFLAGYGAAQAMPGPLFTVAAYLGALSAAGAGGVQGAAIAVAAIFLPGLLLVAGILPFWHEFRQRPGVATAVAGLNAAVVGLLGYALIGLLRFGTIHNIFDFAIVVLALLALTLRKTPPILVVAGCAIAAAI